MCLGDALPTKRWNGLVTIHQMEAQTANGVGPQRGRQSEVGKEKGLKTIHADQVPQVNIPLNVIK